MNSTNPANSLIDSFCHFTQNARRCEDEKRTSRTEISRQNTQHALYFAQTIPDHFLSHFRDCPLQPSNELARQGILSVLQTASYSASREKMQSDFTSWGMIDLYDLCSNEEPLLRGLYFLMQIQKRSPTLLTRIDYPFQCQVVQAIFERTPPEKIDAFVNPFMFFMLYDGVQLQSIEPFLHPLLSKTSDGEVQRVIFSLLRTIDKTQLHPAIDLCLSYQPDFLVRLWPTLRDSVWQEFSSSDKQNLARKFAVASPGTLCDLWVRFCYEPRAFLFSEEDPEFHLEIAQTVAQIAPETFLKSIFRFGNVPFEKRFDLMMKGMHDKPAEILREFATVSLEHQKKLFCDCLQKEGMFKDPEVLRQILEEKDGFSVLIHFWRAAKTEGCLETVQAINAQLVEEYKGEYGQRALKLIIKNQIAPFLKEKWFTVLLTEDNDESRYVIKKVSCGYANLFICLGLFEKCSSAGSLQEADFFIKQALTGYNDHSELSSAALAFFAGLFQSYEGAPIMDDPAIQRCDKGMEKFAFACFFLLLMQDLGDREQSLTKAHQLVSTLRTKNSDQSIRKLIQFLTYLQNGCRLDVKELGRVASLLSGATDPREIELFQTALKIKTQFCTFETIKEFVCPGCDLKQMTQEGLALFKVLFKLKEEEGLDEKLNSILFSKWRQPSLLIEYLRQHFGVEERRSQFIRWVQAVLGSGAKGETNLEELRYGGIEGARNENWDHFRHLSNEQLALWKANRAVPLQSLRFLPKSELDLSSYHVLFTDDPEAIFMHGEDANSCQAISGGNIQNFGLSGVCFNGKNRLCIVIKKGEPIYIHRLKAELIYTSRSKEENRLFNPMMLIPGEYSYHGHAPDNLGEIAETANFLCLLEIAQEMGISVLTDIPSPINAASEDEAFSIRKFEGKIYQGENLAGGTCREGESYGDHSYF